MRDCRETGKEIEENKEIAGESLDSLFCQQQLSSGGQEFGGKHSKTLCLN